jgi:hypothetical protein
MTDESKPDVQYVVQMFLRDQNDKDREVGGLPTRSDSPPLPGTWTDVATVSVKAGTKRRTVLKQALASMEVGDQAPRLRALDMESAEVHEPVAKTTTTWEI